MKYTIGIALLVLTTTGYAGLYKTTVHSRANCLNNESITWWNNHPFKWRVVSIHKHTPTNQMHLIDTGFQYSDRVAAIHYLVLAAVDADEAMRMKMLSDLGLPLPGSGIKIVPRAQLHLSEEQIALGKKAQEEMKTLGYAINPSDYPRELLNIRKQLQSRRKLQAASLSDESTELRPKIQDLKLAFKFEGVTPLKNAHSHRLQGISSSNEITLIGAVPQGGFHKEKGGWSGAAQFFAVKNIGTCSYGVINVKASNTAAELAAGDVTYVINKKPTISTVEGSPNTGFIYKIEWYDNESFHELECANMKYSADLTKSVTNLAKDIDAQSS